MSKLLYLANQWPFAKLRPKLQFKNLIENIHDKRGRHAQLAGRSVVALEALVRDEHMKSVSILHFNSHL